ncbi:MAG: Maf family protein [Dethiobacteria bacterium]|jgi:septum formation protein|nr:septum formation inhibitor Maf [Bacillota bacterium]
MKIILASASQRRAELLKQLGLKFTVVESGVPEEFTAGCPPDETAQILALRKARSVAKNVLEGLVIAADTLVVCGGVILGKPGSAEEAARMLHRLSGTVHKVFTGVALCDAASYKERSVVEETKVWMRPLTEEEIKAYVASDEPYDKAGGYGIQGKAAAFVERIDGCYFNVVGLPLSRLVLLMREFGLSFPDCCAAKACVRGRD